MAEVVLGAVVVVVVAAYCLARLGRWLGAQWFLGLAAR